MQSLIFFSIYFREKVHSYNRNHEVLILQDRNIELLREHYDIDPQVSDANVLRFSFAAIGGF